jgi:flagellar biosynthesis/type III secretory pathway ATPase
VRGHIALYEQKRDLIALGAYAKGSDPRLDAALARIDRIETFLRQDSHESCDFEQTLASLHALA